MLYKKKLAKMKRVGEKQEKTRAEVIDYFFCGGKVGARAMYSALINLIFLTGRVIKYVFEAAVNIVFNLLWLIVPIAISIGIILIMFPDSEVGNVIKTFIEQIISLSRL